jgi:DNA-binding XRE family transcriptional regulator
MHNSVLATVLGLICLAVFITLLVLVFRALRKYVRSGSARREKAAVKRSLGEALRTRRTACKMTQEFVAEAVGVSRQAVSKWESGASDPSTSNLLALAKLYGTNAEELLREIADEPDPAEKKK